MIKNTGKPSEEIFLAAIEGAVFRLRDAKDLHGLNKRRVTAFCMPADFVVVSPNSMFFAEVKSSNNKTSFSLSCFQPAQKAAMVRCYSASDIIRYYVFVHNIITDMWYIIDGGEIVRAIRDKKKSIKWGDLRPLTSWIF